MENIYDQLADFVLDNKDFRTYPGGLSGHHLGEGGLAKHTLEVLEIAMDFRRYTPLNEHVLTLSCLYHDFGKIYEYRKVGERYVRELPPKAHIRLSAEIFVLKAKEYGLDDKTIDDIEYCILTHHHPSISVKEEIPEATILRMADVLSVMSYKS